MEKLTVSGLHQMARADALRWAEICPDAVDGELVWYVRGSLRGDDFELMTSRGERRYFRSVDTALRLLSGAVDPLSFRIVLAADIRIYGYGDQQN